MRSEFNWNEALTAVAAVLGGGLATEMFRAVLRRRADHAASREPASMAKAAAEFSKSLSESGQDMLEEFRKEFRFMRRQIVRLTREGMAAKDAATAAHSIAMSAKEDHARCEERVTMLRAEIDLMMATGRVAHTGEPAPPALKA